MIKLDDTRSNLIKLDQIPDDDHAEQNNHDIIIWRRLGHHLLIVLAPLSMAYNRAICSSILVTQYLVH